MLRGPGCAAGYQIFSIGIVLKACSVGANLPVGREPAAATTMQSANRRESSGADDSHLRCNERDILHTTERHSTMLPVHNSPPAGRD